MSDLRGAWLVIPLVSVVCDSIYFRGDQSGAESKIMSDTINHPEHYGGADDPFECIKVIVAWDLNFCLGNVLKYVRRAGKKDSATALEDLEKAAWYLQYEIGRLKGESD